MSIGEQIRRLRTARNLTQKELGTLCGMADSAIRRYESGRGGNPTQSTLQRIANALEVPVSSLMPSTFSEVLEDETLQAFLDGIKKHLKPLNGIGQQKVSDFAIDYAIDLAKIPEYQNAPPEDPEEAPEGE